MMGRESGGKHKARTPLKARSYIDCTGANVAKEAVQTRASDAPNRKPRVHRLVAIQSHTQRDQLTGAVQIPEWQARLLSGQLRVPRHPLPFVLGACGKIVFRTSRSLFEEM